MSDGGHVRPDTRGCFLSGDWAGFFVHSGKRWPMEMQLWFSNGRLHGHGVDEIAPFLVQGKYRVGDGRVSWLKKYVQRHSVQYVGLGQDREGIWGYWAMNEQFSEFHIWLQREPVPMPPTVGWMSRAASWLVLAGIHQADDSCHEADAALNKALAAVDHQSPSELNSVAWQMHQAGMKPDACEQLIRASLNLDPENPFAAHTLMSILVRQERWAEVWPPLKVWLLCIPGDVLEERWKLYYLSLFKEIVRSGHSRLVANILRETARDDLWLPLSNALLVAGAEKMDESLESLTDTMRRRVLLILRQLTDKE